MKLFLIFTFYRHTIPYGFLYILHPQDESSFKAEEVHHVPPGQSVPASDGPVNRKNRDLVV